MPDPVSCWTKREKGSLVVLCDKNIPWYLYFGVEYRHEPEEVGGGPFK